MPHGKAGRDFQLVLVVGNVRERIFAKIFEATLLFTRVPFMGPSSFQTIKSHVFFLGLGIQFFRVCHFWGLRVLGCGGPA